MNYATFLVHAQADADGEARVTLAADLAKRFEAMLIGVSARGILAPATPPHAGMLVVKLIERQEREIAQELATAERSFRSIAQTGGEKVGWVSELDTPGRVLARESRVADIVVVGRNPHSVASSSYRSADPGDVLMHVGCPVLVVPPGLDHLDASSVLIAWKDTREAHRAVSDSLPFLERASSVSVVAICGTEDKRSAAMKPLAAVVASLGRHGVKASSEARLLREATVPDDLLLAAERCRADLVVAGGYGHTRLQEWVLGGVTRSLIQRFPKCCILSH
jgi:nucleotide-binding universal stress UspA family protein